MVGFVVDGHIYVSIFMLSCFKLIHLYRISCSSLYVNYLTDGVLTGKLAEVLGTGHRAGIAGVFSSLSTACSSELVVLTTCRRILLAILTM